MPRDDADTERDRAVERALQRDELRAALSAIDRERLRRTGAEALRAGAPPASAIWTEMAEARAETRVTARDVVAGRMLRWVGLALGLLAAQITLGRHISAGILAVVAGGVVVDGVAAALQLRRRARDASVWLAQREGTVDEAYVLPLLRELHNRLLGRAFSLEVQLDDVTGLEDLFDERYEVTTRSGSALTSVLGGLRSGSVGVFGARGAGKSTLIQAACAGRLDGQPDGVIGISVPAPVQYDAREFIPFLFARLCLEVIRSDRTFERRRELRRTLTIAGWLTVGYLALAVGIVALVVVRGGEPPGSMIAVGAATAAAVVLYAITFGLTRTMDRVDPLVALAFREQDRLHFTETLTAERSAGLAGRGLSLGRSWGSSRARRALTLPEVTARYRDFLTEAVAGGRTVVIGIDELDKMGSPAEAAAFLNGIKALFGQQGVFYLVSLSEDAAASFEQRGIGFRDVFESVFDQVVLAEPLRPDESRTLLRRRVLGMGPPFAEICHVISGGLPRELIRCAREAAAIAPAPVGEVAARVLAGRAIARQRALQAVAARHVGEDGIQPVLTWLRDLGPDPGPDELLRRCADAPALIGGAPELDAALLGLVAWWYHAATVMAFAADLSAEALERDAGVVDTLARGYLDLAIAPSLAWDTVDRARTALGLTPAPYPLAPAGAGAGAVAR